MITKIQNQKLCKYKKQELMDHRVNLQKYKISST